MKGELRMDFRLPARQCVQPGIRYWQGNNESLNLSRLCRRVNRSQLVAAGKFRLADRLIHHPDKPDGVFDVTTRGLCPSGSLCWRVPPCYRGAKLLRNDKLPDCLAEIPGKTRSNRSFAEVDCYADPNAPCSPGGSHVVS